MNKDATKKSQKTFQRSVLQGLGVALPPLLTIVILLWIFNTVQNYVLTPIEGATNRLISWTISDTVEELPDDVTPVDGEVTIDDVQYVKVGKKSWVPKKIVDEVDSNPGEKVPVTARDYYHRYSEITFFTHGPYIILVAG